jgi:hypothetical protein
MRLAPLIVPPYSQKQNASQHPLITFCWHLARGILSNATRIIVAGYSLPAGDFNIRDLLREAMGSHPPRQDVAVMIINPDSGVAKSFQKIVRTISPRPDYPPLH